MVTIRTRVVEQKLSNVRTQAKSHQDERRHQERANGIDAYRDRKDEEGANAKKDLETSPPDGRSFLHLGTTWALLGTSWALNTGQWWSLVVTGDHWRSHKSPYHYWALDENPWSGRRESNSRSQLGKQRFK